MDPRFRKVAVFVGAAALATGVGVGVASQGGETASSQAAPSQRTGAQGARGGMDFGALAEKLGVTSAELRAAMDAARSAAPAGPQAGQDARAAALAKELGLPTDKVAAALQSLRPQGAPRGIPPAGGAPPGAAPPDDSTAPDGSTTGTTAT